MWDDKENLRRPFSLPARMNHSLLFCFTETHISLPKLLYKWNKKSGTQYRQMMDVNVFHIFVFTVSLMAASLCSGNWMICLCHSKFWVRAVVCVELQVRCLKENRSSWEPAASGTWYQQTLVFTLYITTGRSQWGLPVAFLNCRVYYV